MGNMFLISDVARKLGLTLKALRHYEKIGLVVPERSAESGYRQYSDADVRKLQRVQMLQSLGLSLRQIKLLFREEHDDDTWQTLLEDVLEDTEAEIDMLAERRDRIEEMLAEGISMDVIFDELEVDSGPEMALQSTFGLMKEMQDLQSVTIISSGTRSIYKEEYSRWPIVSFPV